MSEDATLRAQHQLYDEWCRDDELESEWKEYNQYGEEEEYDKGAEADALYELYCK